MHVLSITFSMSCPHAESLTSRSPETLAALERAFYQYWLGKRQVDLNLQIRVLGLSAGSYPLPLSTSSQGPVSTSGQDWVPPAGSLVCLQCAAIVRGGPGAAQSHASACQHPPLFLDPAMGEVVCSSCRDMVHNPAIRQSILVRPAAIASTGCSCMKSPCDCLPGGPAGGQGHGHGVEPGGGAALAAIPPHTRGRSTGASEEELRYADCTAAAALQHSGRPNHTVGVATGWLAGGSLPRSSPRCSAGHGSTRPSRLGCADCTTWETPAS